LGNGAAAHRSGFTVLVNRACAAPEPSGPPDSTKIAQPTGALTLTGLLTQLRIRPA
jgi:hypothetical protein